MKKVNYLKFLFVSLVCVLVSCAGINRGCSSYVAQSFGSDWIVVQYDMNLEPKCAWKLKNVSIANEQQSDGIYWVDSKTGHLIHISGWYNRVQVVNGLYEEAAGLLGIELSKVQNGKYLTDGSVSIGNE